MLPLYLFIGHWYLALFCQTFFLHRYCSHKLFKLNRFWERFFYLMTYLLQGPSFLNPRSYAIMHQQHHQHSDDQEDPHSPLNSQGLWQMMIKTYRYYQRLLTSSERLDQFPNWPVLDRFAASKWNVWLWIGIYLSAYLLLGFSWPWYFLLFVHFWVGPIQGAIVNWCGHKYGYRNFNLPDQSRNSLPIDLLMMGELYQNNHHQFAKKWNFANRWFEIDIAYQVMRVLKKMGVLKIEASSEV